MKKVDSLKNSVVNVLADNVGEKKKILDGCKFCMEKRGCKCDKAEELFNQPSILSPYSPDNWVKYSAFVSEKPLDFPLKCYEYGPAFLRYCDDCQVVYETRHYMGALNENCPHCGKLGTLISDLYQDAYGPYLETDYYYTGFYTPCPYEKGLGCTSAYTENCRKNCFFHPFYIHDSETDTSAVKTAEEVKACAELVESIFCKQQHPTNEDYQRDVEFFRTYEADDAYRLTPCWGNCDGMCELCPINGREKEYVFDNICGRLIYMKESLQHERPYLRSLYMELLDIILVLNQVADNRLNEFVSLIREACIRMDENEVDACVELVVSLFETAKALARVDTSYMRAKDYTEVNTI